MTWDGRNRRKFPRVIYPCLIKIQGTQDQGAKNAILTHTENLSIGGVRIVLKNPIPMATILDIEIDLVDTGDIVSCVGKVVWLEQRSKIEADKPSFYDIGIEFMGTSDADRQRLEVIVAHNIKQGNKI